MIIDSLTISGIITALALAALLLVSRRQPDNDDQ
jgi:hypothetical protein